VWIAEYELYGLVVRDNLKFGAIQIEVQMLAGLYYGFTFDLRVSSFDVRESAAAVQNYGSGVTGSLGSYCEKTTPSPTGLASTVMTLLYLGLK